MTSLGNHENHCFFNIIFLFPLFKATFTILNLKFLAYVSRDFWLAGKMSSSGPGKVRKSPVLYG